MGCFFAPLLRFFVTVGWRQTVRVDRRKNIGEAATWLGRLRSVYADEVHPSGAAMPYSTGLFRWLVVGMSGALILTVVLGIVLAFRTMRLRWLVWLSLGLGIVVPIVFSWLGQKS